MRDMLTNGERKRGFVYNSLTFGSEEEARCEKYAEEKYDRVARATVEK